MIGRQAEGLVGLPARVLGALSRYEGRGAHLNDHDIVLFSMTGLMPKDRVG
jgi:hypothetical protein